MESTEQKKICTERVRNAAQLVRLRGLANDVVQPIVIAERAMTAIMPNDEKGPEHRALGKPVEGPHEWAADGKGASSEANHGDDVSGQVGKRAQGAFVKTFVGYGPPNVHQREGWLCPVVEECLICQSLLELASKQKRSL